MSIRIIAACDFNYGIGYKNELLYRIKKDLKRFRQLTENQIVLMGRRTFESLPAPLPHRMNVVLTRNENYKAPRGVVVETSFDRIINHYLTTGEQDKDLWVIGGAEVYKLFLPYASDVYLTMILKESEKVDTYFPFESLDGYSMVAMEKHYCEEYECDYLFVKYQNMEGSE